MTRTLNIKKARAELKALGYKLNTRTNSTFIEGRVSKDGVQINGGNVITPEFLEEHQAFFDWRRGVKIREDDWIVTI